MKVAVLGAPGRMGQMVVAEVFAQHGLELVAAVTRPGSMAIGSDVGMMCRGQSIGIPVTALGPDAFCDADVVIDFSLPEGTAAAIPLLGRSALVSGTTGLTPGVEAALDLRAQQAPVLTAANFSTGVNLLLHLVREAARALPDFDVEIVEIHHRKKEDAPSGTALALGRAAAAGREANFDEVAIHGRSGRTGARPSGQIGLHAVRGGDVVGDHTVWLAGQGERVSIGHQASSRATFAAGAVRAARWIGGRAPGRYSMRDVLGL